MTLTYTYIVFIQMLTAAQDRMMSMALFRPIISLLMTVVNNVVNASVR